MGSIFKLKVTLLIFSLLFFQRDNPYAFSMQGLRTPNFFQNQESEEVIQSRIIWESMRKYFIVEGYEKNADFIKALSNKILTSRDSKKSKGAYFVIVEGPSGSGKSVACEEAAKQIQKDGGKCVVVKRDWFIGEQGGRRFYQKERIKKILDGVKQFNNTQGEDKAVFTEEGLHGAGNQILEIDKETILIIDGGRELNDLIGYFDFKILLAVEDPQKAIDRRVTREEQKSSSERRPAKAREKRGISYWITKGFGADIDLIVRMDDVQKPQIFLPLKKAIGIRKEGGEGDVRLIIERCPRPDKKFAMKDYLSANKFKAENGIYIGNETKPIESNVDQVLLEVQGLAVFAVDKFKVDAKTGIEVDKRATYVGEGTGGAKRILERLVALCKGEAPKQQDPVDITLIKVLNSAGKHFIVLDIDGTILEHNDIGKEILEYLVYLIQEQKFHIAFMTKNNEKNTWERVGRYLSSRLKAKERGKVTAYTSATVKKMVLSKNEFQYATGNYGRYLSSTMIQKNIKDALLLTLENIEADNEYNGVITIEARGTDDHGNISQFRLGLKKFSDDKMTGLINRFETAVSKLTDIILGIQPVEDIDMDHKYLHDRIHKDLLEIRAKM